MRSRAGALGHRHGVAAEDQALAAYARHGCHLLARRWRGPSGEIDLILSIPLPPGPGPAFTSTTGAAGVIEGASARAVPTLTIFVEVKAGRDADAAMARITPRQVARIHRAAAEYLDAAGTPFAETRFDAALVHDGGRITIVENALAHL